MIGISELDWLERRGVGGAAAASTQEQARRTSRVDCRRVISGILHVLGRAAEGLPAGVWTRHHDLQTHQPVERAGAPDQSVCAWRRLKTSRTSPASSVPTSRRISRSLDQERGLGSGDLIGAVPRSRGGRTSKIYALADAQGRPTTFVLTPGNVAGISIFATLLNDIATPWLLLADKAYDADHLGKPLETLGKDGDPLQQHATVPLSTQQDRLPPPQTYRAHVLPHERLAPDRDLPRPARQELPVSHRTRRDHLLLAHLIESTA